MSQYDFGVIDPNVKTGTQLALDLNQWRDALHSSHAGVARPAYIKPGGVWVAQPAADRWILNVNCGAIDAPVGEFNPAAGSIVVNGACPPGTVVAFAGAAAPTGWLLCAGQSVLTATYPALFAVLGYTYGGAGANFNVPDLRGRVIAGVDNMGGTAANRLTAGGSGINGAVRGGGGGAETVALVLGQLPTHSHYAITGNDNGDHTHTGSSGVESAVHVHSGSTGTESALHQHYFGIDNNVDAYGGIPNANGAAVIASRGTDNNATSHSHSYSSSTESANHAHTLTTGGRSAVHQHAINAEGSNSYHQNAQPTLVLNHIIKI